MSLEREESGTGSCSRTVADKGDPPVGGELPEEGVEVLEPDSLLSPSLSESERQIGSSYEVPVALLAPVPTCLLLPRTSSPKPPSGKEQSSCFTVGTCSAFTAVDGEEPLLLSGSNVVLLTEGWREVMLTRLQSGRSPSSLLGEMAW